MSRSPEQKQLARDQYDELSRGVNSILKERPPQEWWFGIMRYLKRVERSLEQLEPEVRQYVQDVLTQVYDVLMGERTEEAVTDIDKASRANIVIHKISHIIEALTPDREHGEIYKVTRLSLESLVSERPDRLRFSTERTLKIGGGEIELEAPVKCISIYSEIRDEWYPIPLPLSDKMAHKGGAPRVLVKILAGAPAETIEAELPPNDFDVIAVGDQAQAELEAKAIGVDKDGVEMVQKVDYQQYFSSRDIDLNSCLLAGDKLIYSDAAETAAQTGKIQIFADDRGLYGSEFYYYDKERIIKNRGLYRLFKFVAEGKATGFDFNKLNEQVDFGIYWLVLGRKFMRKDDPGYHLNRLFDLAKQTGQVRPGEKNIIDVLDRAHQEFPFFDFGEKSLDEVGLAQWLGRKLTKFSGKTFRMRNGIPSNLTMERTPGDTKPYLVSLDDYQADDNADLQVGLDVAGYLERCRQRTDEYQETVLESAIEVTDQ
ncbi:MAG: hypothetical protein COW24_05185 [Candidatus Kerfeldbacteria bacterium CG15_BIG_FIL_POST_REV_8_21_14_020_45_12]|uniref:Uncharacterized protein n=1 Tax=Candidatus Kerfeldbacteria bacterium CG15_BIG_FIL_POST_REV_8_21_14_020_45_12 TaxID=2014247 RepID=A0A2M7H2K4_9BACT|nr:MAG: hypothetical protein COW24_05185 [Candidatus Kerfeldbacteria bacterium CG15_BIG_FIL_POST_REV_8_21_14_020_45_12]PJA92837.1 MAG: hypothetical protein CO132_05560 [Candidatus Kerfeldbacteria bacterium CG_4_9_14_3_um_filter_45_8]